MCAAHYENIKHWNANYQITKNKKQKLLMYIVDNTLLFSKLQNYISLSRHKVRAQYFIHVRRRLIRLITITGI